MFEHLGMIWFSAILLRKEYMSIWNDNPVESARNSLSKFPEDCSASSIPPGLGVRFHFWKLIPAHIPRGTLANRPAGFACHFSQLRIQWHNRLKSTTSRWFHVYSFLKDQAMFKMKRSMINPTSGYEKVADNDSDHSSEEKKPVPTSDDDNGVSVHSPLISSPPGATKYVWSKDRLLGFLFTRLQSCLFYVSLHKVSRVAYPFHSIAIFVSLKLCSVAFLRKVSNSTFIPAASQIFTRRI